MWKESQQFLKEINEVPKEQLTSYGNENVLKVICSFMATVSLDNTECSMNYSAYAKFFVVKGTELSLLSYHTACDLKVLRVGLAKFDINLASSENEFPKIPMEPVMIRIRPEVPSRQIIRYNIPKAFEKAAVERLCLMEKRGIIEKVKEQDEITSVSPLVLVPKGEKDFRIVMDYREVNKRIIREPYPLPQLDRIWAEIPPAGSGKRLYLTVLDLSEAFFHIEIDEKVRHVTTFMTAGGLMRFRRLPFGLCISPELFQKTMERVLCQHKGIIVYLDDILITGTSHEDLKKRTEEVKATLKKNNLTINEKKSKYCQDSVDFLGFTIDGQGIAPMRKKIVDIENFKAPKNISQLRSFLGMMTFISPFIKNFSHKTQPLRELLKDKTSFEWREEHQQAFDELKAAAEKDILKRGYFDEQDKTILYTDASPWGIGAVLVQEKSDRSDQRIIACASKSLSAAESKYPQLHREALAIVWSMERFAYYLLGRRFTLKCDNEALMFMTKHSKLRADSGRRVLSRAEGWFLRMEYFDFDFKHVSGEENIADAASRISGAKTEPDFEMKREPFEICSVRFDMDGICRQSLKMSPEEVRVEVFVDNEISEVLKWLRGEQGLAKELMAVYKPLRDQLHIHKDVLMIDGKLVLPKTLRERAIDFAHKGHQQASEMKVILRQTVWWPDINIDISNRAHKCQICRMLSEKPEQSTVNSLEAEERKILSARSVIKETSSDEQLMKVMKWLAKDEKWPEDISAFEPFRKDLFVDGEVLKRKRFNEEKTMFVLPRTLRKQALETAHVAHPGMTTTKNFLRKGVWWPGMDRDVEIFVRSCAHCQLVTDTTRPLPIVQTALPNGPWDFVSMDFSTASDKEHWKALVLTDHYSRFLVAIPMNKTDVAAVQKALQKTFQTYYYPKTIRADNGPPFQSPILEEWLAKLGVKLIHSTPLNPTENGQVERHMQGINKISAIARLEKRNWNEVLAEYVAAYNVWPHSSTKQSPADLMFGRAVRHSIPNPQIDEKCYQDDEMRDHDQITKFKRNRLMNEKRHAVDAIELKIGDIVLMKQQKKDKVDTPFKNTYFEVMDIEGEGRVKIKELESDKIFWRCSKQLKKFHKRVDSVETEAENFSIPVGEDPEASESSAKPSAEEEEPHQHQESDQPPVLRRSSRVRELAKQK